MLMSCFDIHTHQIPLSSTDRAVYACTMQDVAEAGEVQYRSVGIHPWYLTEANAEEQLQWLYQAVKQPDVVAVGECGLDKLRGASMSLQQEVFRACISLAEQMHLPLVVHAVKCTEELFRIHKELKPQMPWIIHGFRGRKEVAEQYLKRGFYLSFGEHFHDEALRSTPLEWLLLETDESRLSMEEICRKAASVYGLPAEILAARITSNAQKVLFLQ